jgi:hypothetical protein
MCCRYDVKCKMIDQAVSMDKNAGFTHWRSRVVNKVGGRGLWCWCGDAIDQVTCAGHALQGFTHWRSRVVNKVGGRPA